MATRVVVCLSSEGYEASLELRKLYRLLADPGAERRGLLRVVDESDEDYLYPARMFGCFEVPDELASKLGLA